MYALKGDIYTVITDVMEARALAARVRTLPWCSLDAETTDLDPYRGVFRLLQFGIMEADGHVHSYIVDLYQVPLSALRAAFTGDCVFLGHNLGFDVKWLRVYGIIVKMGCVYDTMIAAKVCENGMLHLVGKHNLGAVIMRTVGIDMDKALQKSDWSGDLTDEQIRYAALDVQYLHLIAQVYGQVATRDDLNDTIKLEMECVITTAKMEADGMRTDPVKVHALSVRAAKLLEKQDGECQAIMGKRRVVKIVSTRVSGEVRTAQYADLMARFNQAKTIAEANGQAFPWDPPPKQLVPLWQKHEEETFADWKLGSTPAVKIWFKSNGVPIPLVMKKNPITKQREPKESLDEDALTIVRHPIGPALVAWRKTQKILSTYLGPMPEWVNPVSGNIHTSFNQIVSSGRRSSSRPNLQNIPTRGSDLAKEMRGLFIPDLGKLLLIADFEQIELYLIAMLSFDPIYCAQILDRIDLHAAKSLELFGIIGLPKNHPDRKAWEEGANYPGIHPYKEYKRWRDVAKTYNFASWYGAWARQLDVQSGRVLGLEKSEQVLITMHNRHPRIVDYFSGVTRKSFELGYTTTLLGRRRYLYRPDPSDKGACSQASREMNNTKIQGTGADMNKAAEVEIYNAGLDLRMVNHDETVCNTDPEKAEYERTLVEQCMIAGARRILNLSREPFDERIMIGAETTVARNWGEKG